MMPLRLPPHIISHIVTGAVLCAAVGICALIKISSADDKKKNMSCANCGKTEEDGNTTLKACVACKMVKYCNRECQIQHRSHHKEECKKRAAELHDEKLFKQPPLLEDCPICMIRLPTLVSGRTYMNCCGKMICSGCIYSVQLRAALSGRRKEDDICPFCRTSPAKKNEETIRRYEKRIELNDAYAIYNMGGYHARGLYGLPRNIAKGLELWHRAGERGSAEAHGCIGIAHDHGDGVERDLKKARHYWELAAINGDLQSRYNLGSIEVEGGNMERALKHFMIAVRSGCSDSLDYIKQSYLRGYTTKDMYAEALRSYQSYLDEIKSDQRDDAAAFKDEWKYF